MPLKLNPMIRKPESRTVAERPFQTRDQAKQAFKRQRNALLNVNCWDKLAAGPNTFQLFDKHGERSLHARAYQGDFIKIDAPGPTPANWVVIETIKVARKYVRLVVRPSYDPTKRPIDPEVTAHLFRSKATNTFSLKRTKKLVLAAIVGRAEYANTVQPEAGNKAVLNFAASVGLWFTFQEEIWTTFVKRLLSIAPKRLAHLSNGVRVYDGDGVSVESHQAAVEVVPQQDV